MKNIYYIGREETCDILLQDDTNLISRIHAILRVRKGGRYTISDQSMNGTFVNGVRISPGVEVPVSRTDVINFAQVIDFEWDLIPDIAKKRKILAFSVAGGLLLLAALCWGGIKLFKGKQTRYYDDFYQESQVSTPKDTTKTDTLRTPPVEPPADPVKPVEPKKPVTKGAAKTPASKPAPKEEQPQADPTPEEQTTNAIF